MAAAWYTVNGKRGFERKRRLSRRRPSSAETLRDSEDPLNSPKRRYSNGRGCEEHDYVFVNDTTEKKWIRTREPTSRLTTPFVRVSSRVSTTDPENQSHMQLTIMGK